MEQTQRMLIIKTGATLPAMAARRGDFEDWIVAGLGSEPSETWVVDVQNGSRLPSHGDVSGIVITGSRAMVTDHHNWSEGTATWLRGAVERQVPTLGICYGHQLLAYAMGGEVGDNPNGLEVGTVDVHLNEMSQDDPLLGGLPRSIRVQAYHTQSVLRLPPGARPLASSALDPHHAFVVAERAWGVQFHPEFDAAIMIELMHHFGQDLQKQGMDPDLLIRDCEDTRHGSDILRRFAEVVNEKRKT